jgi:hypothetical protein
MLTNRIYFSLLGYFLYADPRCNRYVDLLIACYFMAIITVLTYMYEFFYVSLAPLMFVG